MKMKTFFINFVSLTVFVATVFGVNAAENGRSRGGTMTTVTPSSARMPSIPIVTMNVVGNPAVNVVNEPAAISNTGSIPQPTPPQPTPPQPTPPASQCADGGVQNTDYTVDMCMNDLQMCVNSSVTNGIAGLYNEDYFKDVLNGNLRICQNVVDKCLTVRKNCKNVYKTQKAVWLDFRIRILQPSYYNFVLQKTGLTPYQAKKTCLRIGGRWDAVSADCSVRVVAYNKGKRISNEWLFGAAGNGKDAEAWLNTGSSFSCGKSLFGFSLLNDTATAAVVGIGGGTVLGATAGGLIAKAKQNKAKRQALKDPCTDKEFRKTFGAKIAGTHNERVLMNYLVEPTESYETVGRDDGYSSEYGYDPNTQTFYSSAPKEKTTNAKKTRKIDFYNLGEDECSAIIDLYSIANLYDEAVKMCAADAKNARIMKLLGKKLSSDSSYSTVTVETDGNGNIIAFHMGELVCDDAEVSEFTEADIAAFNEECLLKRLEIGFGIQNDDNPFCATQTGCRSYLQIQQDLDSLRSVLNQVEVVVEPEGSGPSVGKGILVGGLVGAGVGGLATGITAVIEKNNISCKVENDLGSVSFGKSYTIDSLKSFYVRYALNLPDSVLANTPVTDKNSWGLACSEFQGKQDDCENASVLYRRDSKREVVPFACSYTGSMCLMNKDVAELYGIQ